MPAALTTTSHSTRPLSVSTAATRPSRVSIAGHRRARLELRAEPARRVGERERQLARVEVAVVGDERRRDDAVGRHRREELLRLLRRHDLHRQAERLRPRRLAPQLLVPRLRRREPEAAELVPAGIVAGQLLQLGVEPDRVLHHPRQRDRRAQLADEAGAVPGRAVRQLVLLDEERVRPALLREVVEDGAADHAAADHDRPRALRNHAAEYFTFGLGQMYDRAVALDDVLAAVPELHGATAVEPLAGGLTNTNYKVDDAGRLLRRPHLGQGHRPARDRPRERGAQHALRRGDRRRRAASSPPCPSTTRSCSSSSTAR